MIDIKCAKAIGTFVGGILFGTAGIAVLTSKDAKKAYTHCTAAVLRGKDSVVKTAVTLKENCEDIYADAVDINEARYAAEEEAMVEEAKAIVEAYSCDADVEADVAAEEEAE